MSASRGGVRGAGDDVLDRIVDVVLQARVLLLAEVGVLLEDEIGVTAADELGNVSAHNERASLKSLQSVEAKVTARPR
jgi:ribosomal protein L7/L12